MHRVRLFNQAMLISVTMTNLAHHLWGQSPLVPWKTCCGLGTILRHHHCRCHHQRQEYKYSHGLLWQNWFQYQLVCPVRMWSLYAKIVVFCLQYSSVREPTISKMINCLLRVQLWTTQCRKISKTLQNPPNFHPIDWWLGLQSWRFR